MVVFVEFAVFAIHLVVDDRVPVFFAQARRNVVLARPTAEFEFFDEIDFALIDLLTVRVHGSTVMKESVHRLRIVILSDNECEEIQKPLEIREDDKGFCKNAGNDLLSP